MGIVKKNQVRRVEASASDANGPAAPADGAARHQARIIEQNDDHAVVEITCACGTTMRLRCDYAAAAP